MAANGAWNKTRRKKDAVFFGHKRRLIKGVKTDRFRQVFNF